MSVGTWKLQNKQGFNLLACNQALVSGSLHSACYSGKKPNNSLKPKIPIMQAVPPCLCNCHDIKASYLLCVLKLLSPYPPPTVIRVGGSSRWVLSKRSQVHLVPSLMGKCNYCSRNKGTVTFQCLLQTFLNSVMCYSVSKNWVGSGRPCLIK